jgi:DUF917 family protein
MPYNTRSSVNIDYGELEAVEKIRRKQGANQMQIQHLQDAQGALVAALVFQVQHSQAALVATQQQGQAALQQCEAALVATQQQLDVSYVHNKAIGMGHVVTSRNQDTVIQNLQKVVSDLKKQQVASEKEIRDLKKQQEEFFRVPSWGPLDSQM